MYLFVRRPPCSCFWPLFFPSPRSPCPAAPQRDLLPCTQALSKAQTVMQQLANAECRTVFQCVECVSESSKQNTCKSLAVQPQKGKCASTSIVDAKAQGENVNLEAAPSFSVEVLQSVCYKNGATLEAVVVNDAQSKPDGKAQMTGYSYLWEIDGGKGGHAAIVNCVNGKKAVVRVTKLSTGETVSRSVALNNTQVYTKPTPTAELVGVYRKTSCYGTCPVFEAQFFSDGTISWNGIANVSSAGKLTKKTDASTIGVLKEQVTQLGFFSLGEKYPEYPIWDASSTIIYFNNGNKQHQVSSVTGAPQSFDAVAKKFEEILAKQGISTAPGGGVTNRKAQGAKAQGSDH